jgi:hypothetical protein
VELDGVVLAKDALAVVVDWNEQIGKGYVRLKGMPNGALINRAALQQAGFDTCFFADVIRCDVANFDGVRVAVNIKAVTEAIDGV